MKKLLTQVTKVIKSLNKNGFTFKSEDNCEDHLEYLDVEGHEVIVGDDTNRESWNVSLNSIKGEGDLTELLVKVLGKPSKIHTGDRKVYNWEPTKNVIIVFFEDSIEFSQDYEKR
jgi:hypothetical protein